MGTHLESFVPDEWVSSVYAIDLDKLWMAGKRLILTDLDNTLAPWNDATVPVNLVAWLAQVRDKGFVVCVLSNNNHERVAEFVSSAGIDGIGKARKPKAQAYHDAMKRYRCTAAETVMIGDQLYTDIRGAKRCGVYCILVTPISPREFWGTRLVRVVERRTIRRLIAKGHLPAQPRLAQDERWTT